jgi:hypothetical protein
MITDHTSLSLMDSASTGLLRNDKIEQIIKKIVGLTNLSSVSQQPPGNLGEAGSLAFCSTAHTACRTPGQFSAIIQSFWITARS